MSTDSLTLRPSITHDDLIIKNRSHEIRSIPESFTPESIEIDFKESVLILGFSYSVIESPTTKYFPSIRLLVGRYTGKILRVEMDISNVKELEMAFDEIILGLKDLQRQATTSSVKKSYEIIITFIKKEKKHIIDCLNN